MLKSISVNLSQSDILSLATSPIPFGLPVMSGLMHVPVMCVLNYKFGTVAYTDVHLYVKNYGNYAITNQVNGLLNQTQDYSIVSYGDSLVALPDSDWVQTDLYLSALSNPTAGDGTVKATLFYSDVTVP